MGGIITDQLGVKGYIGNQQRKLTVLAQSKAYIPGQLIGFTLGSEQIAIHQWFYCQHNHG